jgi:hypothetical protein
MRWGLILIAGLMASPAAAQKLPKIDSLLVVLPKPKADAAEAVVAAFTQAGLGITNTTPTLVEADLGDRQSSFGKYSRHYTVRAVIIAAGDSSRVLIRGTDDVMEGQTVAKRRTIDSYAKKYGGEVWAKMVAAAKTLDASQVPPEAEAQK